MSITPLAMIETSEMLSLGGQLRRAREAMQLSIDEVAQKTNLKKNHIDAFENDQFILQNVPPAFVRGYVRNYVRFLRLPENMVAQVNYGETSPPIAVKKTATISVSHNHTSQRRWVKRLTWVILLCAVGMTLAWWWQEHQKDEQTRSEMVSTAVTESENSGILSLTPATPVMESSSSTQVSVPSSELVATIPPAVEAVPTTTPASSVTTQETAAAETIAATPVEETTPVEAPTANTNNEVLRIEITQAQSWITVRGTKNKRSLAEKLYVAGDVLTFNDADEQYRLTIGAPAYVKVYYKGQEVPMKLDSRVARIKLPQ